MISINKAKIPTMANPKLMMLCRYGMNSSVITSQELKMDELHSIRNIARDAAALGLSPTSIPPVELEP